MSKDTKADLWPPRPTFDPLYSNEKLWDAFGKFSYKADPLPDNPEHIIVTDKKWLRENLFRVVIPQLNSKDQKQLFHKKVIPPLLAIWAEWEKGDLISLIKTFNGGYAPRFRKNSNKKLSVHAFGAAFDINAKWNPLGEVPALVGEPGSVRKLVKIANKHGFFWGGHFNQYPDGKYDGMHFEAAVFKKKMFKKKPMKKKKKKGHKPPMKKKN